MKGIHVTNLCSDSHIQEEKSKKKLLTNITHKSHPIVNR